MGGWKSDFRGWRMSASSDHVTSMVVNGVRLEAIDRGSGPPLLFLHPGIGIDPKAAVLDLLARNHRVIAPTHPGFGGSDLPKGMSTVDDLSYFYLDLLEALDLRDVAVVGVSFGAWIAAEIAVKTTERLSHLVLANAVGIKVADRETRDIVDIWALTDEQFASLAYFDPKLGTPDYKNMPDAEVQLAARNREATARFGWSPYLHNPKLKGRLHRIRIPTLFLWGMADRILSEHYGRAFCAAITGAQFEPIERAGHFPHIEQPQEFARRTLAFIDAKPAKVSARR
jgi:pimeloyl-ACP methyl ester carboxylesterase